MQRVGALWGGRAAPSPLRPPEPVPAPAGAPVAAPAIDAAGLQQAQFDWVIGVGPAQRPALDERERQLLASLDAVLGSSQACAALLPRAPAVIPQLLNILRDNHLSTDALAQRVMRDPHLVAEVIRMANSAQARASAPVGDIAEAIGRLGTNGLRRAIARVVLKPMFVGTADTLSARCAQRLWQNSDAKAAACQQEAVKKGLDPFEGYLTGLMHNIGWTAALRAIDGSQGGAPGQFSPAFVAAFEPRRNRFFATLVTAWQLTPGLTALGGDLLHGDLASVGSLLGQALRVADERATLEMPGAAAVAH
jgi:hypothetical protein